MPTPRGLSQAPTSFIGSWCLDIHRLPLVACHTTKNYKDARVHYTVLKIRAGTPTPNHHPRTEPQPQGKHTQNQNPTHSLVRAGPSHTTTPTATPTKGDPPAGAASDPEKPNHPDHSGTARFLRTQQRASTHPHPSLTFHTPEEAVLTRSVKIQA